MSPWQLIIIFLVVVFYAIPIFLITKKAGFSSPLAFLFCVISLVPILNFVVLWILALIDWPNLRRKENPNA